MNQLTSGGVPSYIGRFAPSPTGPLHAGSLVAALASWLDARAHAGQWLVRIEDLDTPRCVPGADVLILQQLAACGLLPDAAPIYQSQRGSFYQSALDALVAAGRAYPCACTRKEIEGALAATGQARSRHEELRYPGTCRAGLHGRTPRAWRFGAESSRANVPPALAVPAQAAPDFIADQELHWNDRWLGPQQQNVSQVVGDFVLKRADGLWAYQLAVVVDDGAQGITDVVRGVDLADNTARQILLQRALGLPLPRYLHVALVRAADGEKLSKQNGALPLDLRDPLQALRDAGGHLGLPPGLPASTPGDWLQQAVGFWATKIGL
jgi:glutamyl-Q tRNA(Asp) synthetase